MSQCPRCGRLIGKPAHTCMIRSLEERFWEKVDASGDCWLFTGTKDNHGYGNIDRGGRGLGNAKAHRVAYELLVGPIPEGKELDHLCRVHACVNPDHLEPVTHLVNVRRGQSPRIRTARSGFCKRGHPRVWGQKCRPCINLLRRLVPNKVHPAHDPARRDEWRRHISEGRRGYVQLRLLA
jgi:hypothetical protein